MAELPPNGFDRFGAWLFSLRGQLTCFACCVLFLALSAFGEELMRACGYEGFFAPTRDAYWRGIAVGSAVGLFPLLTVLLRNLVIFQFRPLRSASGELTGWRLWAGYLYTGFYLILSPALVMVLFFWCRNSGLSFIPPMIASLVVQCLIGLLWRGLFGSEPSDTVAEPVRTEN
jgi:hypothetical protein